MYIDPKRKGELLESGIMTGNETCDMCEKAPVIIWSINSGPLLLCGECAQYLGTQLLKDVRNYEIDNHLSVKVRTELVERPQ